MSENIPGISANDLERLMEAVTERVMERVASEFAAKDAELDAVDALLIDVLDQACGIEKPTDPKEEIDSMALTAYAEALLYLAKRGKFFPATSYGRRVIGTFRRPT